MKSLTAKDEIQTLLDAVKQQIDASVAKLTNLNVDNDWAPILVAFRLSHMRFKLIRLGTSVFGNSDNSISYIFDALIAGLEINEKEWNTAVDKPSKNKMLEGILKKIGDGLEKLNRDEYYEEAIGSGTTDTMKSIFKILQGKTSSVAVSRSTSRGGGGGTKRGSRSSSRSRRSVESSSDWKDRLASVMDKVDDLKAKGGASGVIFEGVKERMHKAVGRINGLDLTDDWEEVNNKLHEKRGYFLALSHSPGGGGAVFTALYDGMDVIDGDEWRSADDEASRDAAMDSLLKVLGENLKNVPKNAYDSILRTGGDVKMYEIADILEGVE